MVTTNEQPAPNDLARPPRRWRWRTALALLLSPVIMATMALLALQTPWAKALVTATAAGILGPMLGQDITISGLSGVLPFRVELERFAMADAEGEWLEVERVRLSWSARALLNGRVVVHELDAGRVALPRIGAFPGRDKAPEPFSLPQVPALPDWIEVRRLAVERIEIGEALLRENAVFRLEGALSQPGLPEPSTLRLTLVRLDADTTEASVAIALDATSFMVDIAARDERILPGLLNIEGPAVVTLQGDAPLDGWHGTLAASLGDAPLLEGELGLRVNGGVDATARFALHATHPAVPAAVPERVGDVVDMVLALRLDADGRLHIDELTASSEAVQVSLAGLLDLPGNAMDLRVEALHADMGTMVALDEAHGPQALNATLTLKGGLDELSIELDADWNEASLARGHVGLNLADGVITGVELRVFPPTVFLPSDEAAGLLTEGIALVADVPSLSRSRIQVARFNMSGVEGLAIAGEADFDFVSGDGRADFVVELSSLDNLAKLTGQPFAGSAKLAVQAGGTGDRMQVVVVVEGDALTYAEYAVEVLRLKLDGALEGWANGQPNRITATWNGHADGLALAPYPGERIEIEGAIEAPTMEEFRLTRVTVSDGVVRAEAVGRFLPQSTSGSLELSAQAASIAPYGALTGMELAGTAALRLSARLDEDGESGAAELDLDLGQLGGLPEPAQGLIGSALTIRGRGTLADGMAALESLALDAAHVSAAGSGTYGLESGAVSGTLTASLPDLAAASATLGPAASGAVELEAELSGKREALVMDARVQGTNIGAGPAHADTLSLAASVTGLPKTPTGQVTLRATERGQQLDAEAGFSLADAVVKATGVSLTLGGNHLTAEGQYQLDTGLPEGSVTIDFADLGAFEPFAGVALDGSIRGDLAVSPADRDATADIALEAVDIVAPFGRLSNLTVSGSVTGLRSDPAGSFTANLTALDSGAVRVDSLLVVAEGRPSQVGLEAELVGSIVDTAPFDLRLAAEAAPESGTAAIQAFGGHLEQYTIALENPASIAFHDGEFRLDALVLHLGDGRLEAHAAQTAERVDARIAFSDVPLGIANAFGAPEVTGTARGSVDLTGTLSEPMLELAVEVIELRTALAIEPDTPPFSAESTARLSPTTLDAKASLHMSEATHIDAEVALPVVFSLSPFAFEAPEDALLEARLLGNILMQEPLAFAGMVEHRLEGNLSLDYRAQGSVGAPSMSGAATIVDGRYENTRAGTVLHAINLEVASNDTAFTASLSATDGGTGTLSLEAEGLLDRATDFPFSAEGEVNTFMVLRRDDASVRLDGTVSATGDLSDFAVAGDFRVGQSTFVLSIPRGGRIPEVDYIEVGAGIEPVDEKDGPVVVETPMTIRLDISASFPGRVTIRGPGLDSEWSGNLSVTGTAATPVVRGELRVLRGHLDILDRRFALTDSLIVLDGSTPPNPYLNVRGQVRAAEVTAFILITGTPDALTLRLESDPPLPQDEVLARVLFNRPIEDITPVQALQLARSARQLSGSLRGDSILGARGGLLPFDRFDISPDTDGTGETTIGAGAYLSDDIFVQIRQKLQSGSTAVSIDVELRRNLSVQGEVGTDGRTGAGVVYKWDY